MSSAVSSAMSMAASIMRGTRTLPHLLMRASRALLSPRPLRHHFLRRFDTSLRAALAFVVTSAFTYADAAVMRTLVIPFLVPVLALLLLQPTLGQTLALHHSTLQGVVCMLVLNVILLSAGLGAAPRVVVGAVIFVTSAIYSYVLTDLMARRFALCYNALVLGLAPYITDDAATSIYLDGAVRFTAENVKIVVLGTAGAFLLSVLPFPRLAVVEAVDRWTVSLAHFDRTFHRFVDSFVATGPMAACVLREDTHILLETLQQHQAVMRARVGVIAYEPWWLVRCIAPWVRFRDVAFVAQHDTMRRTCANMHSALASMPFSAFRTPFAQSMRAFMKDVAALQSECLTTVHRFHDPSAACTTASFGDDDAENAADAAATAAAADDESEDVAARGVDREPAMPSSSSRDPPPPPSSAATASMSDEQLCATMRVLQERVQHAQADLIEAITQARLSVVYEKYESNALPTGMPPSRSASSSNLASSGTSSSVQVGSGGGGGVAPVSAPIAAPVAAPIAAPVGAPALASSLLHPAESAASPSSAPAPSPSPSPSPLHSHVPPRHATPDVASFATASSSDAYPSQPPALSWQGDDVTATYFFLFHVNVYLESIHVMLSDTLRSAELVDAERAAMQRHLATLPSTLAFALVLARGAFNLVVVYPLTVCTKWVQAWATRVHDVVVRRHVDWVFARAAVRNAIAITICSTFQLESNIEAVLTNAYWAAFTSGIITSDNTGTLILRGGLRVFGTLLGALVGYIVSIIAQDDRVTIVVLDTLWLSLAGYFATDPMFAYFGVVSSLTCPLVSLGALETSGIEPGEYALKRSQEVLIGVVVTTLVNLVLWPTTASATINAELQSVVQIFSDGVGISLDAYARTKDEHEKRASSAAAAAAAAAAVDSARKRNERGRGEDDEEEHALLIVHDDDDVSAVLSAEMDDGEAAADAVPVRSHSNAIQRVSQISQDDAVELPSLATADVDAAAVAADATADAKSANGAPAPSHESSGGATLSTTPALVIVVNDNAAANASRPQSPSPLFTDSSSPLPSVTTSDAMVNNEINRLTSLNARIAQSLGLQQRLIAEASLEPTFFATFPAAQYSSIFNLQRDVWRYVTAVEATLRSMRRHADEMSEHAHRRLGFPAFELRFASLKVDVRALIEHLQSALGRGAPLPARAVSAVSHVTHEIEHVQETMRQWCADYVTMVRRGHATMLPSPMLMPMSAFVYSVVRLLQHLALVAQVCDRLLSLRRQAYVDY